MHDKLAAVRRALRKPPRVLLRRLLVELNGELARFRAPRRLRSFSAAKLTKAVGSPDMRSLWDRLSNVPYPAVTQKIGVETYDALCPHDGKRILKQAEEAVASRVNLLGSGVIDLGLSIDWHKDYKSGFSWPVKFFRDIDYFNRRRPSDVKFPWELSRMHWLMPVGQAYLLSSDESYAVYARGVLDQWIDANPYCRGVNWTCTMEVALRILSWTWMFHAFKNSIAWSDERFRERFLMTLFLHCEYTERHLEFSDINSNHYAANGAGLLFGGLFFGRGQQPERWTRLGWNILCGELPRQVLPDGVDFEGSIAYHRLVMELFLLPARYRSAVGLTVPAFYRSRLEAMANFTRAYTRQDGSTPLLGDADDGRALPFGGQKIGDHRYLPALVLITFAPGVRWEVPNAVMTELFWHVGAQAAQGVGVSIIGSSGFKSQAFRDGGVFVMRNSADHILIDCGPVGLNGRGGHGHNDCLSFEASLNGVHLVTDCGSFVYTSDYDARNYFRSTACHNTPQIDGQELNRLLDSNYLFHLENDAIPTVITWQPGEVADTFCGSHSGYDRLRMCGRPVRTITLQHATHTLTINDRFIGGSSAHTVRVPLHLAIGISVEEKYAGHIYLISPAGQRFVIRWGGGPSWKISIEDAAVSTSYGTRTRTQCIVWENQTLAELTVEIAPVLA